MDYELSWVIPGRVILTQIGGALTHEEILESDQRLCHMLDEGDPNFPLVHQIIMFGDLANMPGLKTLSAMQSAKHPRNGWSVIVGVKNPLLKMIGSLGAQIAQVRIREADSLEAALAFLCDVDATLPREYALND